MVRALALAARHGRAALVLGLLAGLLLPGLAATLQPWLPEMVAGLLFLNAYRIGLRKAAGGLADGIGTVKAIALLQVGLPLLALGLASLFGVAQTPAAVALILMLSAPSVTGSPNITALMGHAPEPAFRLLILGTALMPLTVIPVFLLAPGLGGLGDVLRAAGRFIGVIGITVVCAFLLRRLTLPQLREDQAKAIDGLTVIALAVIVVGLMAALGPALRAMPLLVLQWLGFALAANLGLQALTFAVMRRRAGSGAVPVSVVAGNRNFALFLIALPAATTDPLLIFLGCYQIPMYLTAILMKPLYGRAALRTEM
ncbi:hypothetical protein J4729_09125 [Leisingera sp. HS039]|uniref:hypothetical protein n=1 Tax=unclassified Leisingera TaxID=2614906 RepID=UPI0010714F31|nr:MULTISPECIES: hypothetical protein [unclassified Leisingera]MBQ4824703.1 hypothetical protein [Leisingera sp. HS039]QBR35587.1 hypothetical protein ETW23_04955 [Leisingera sp. NJS201]